MANIQSLDSGARAREDGEDELDAALTADYGLFSGPARHEAHLRFTAERARPVWSGSQVSPAIQRRRRYELTVLVGVGLDRIPWALTVNVRAFTGLYQTSWSPCP